MSAMTDAVRRTPEQPAPTRRDALRAEPRAPDRARSGEERLLRDLFERGGLAHDEPPDAARAVPVPVVLPRSLQGLPLPGLGTSPAGAAIERRAERALQKTFGADVDAMVLSSGVTGGKDGKVHVEAFVAGGTVRFALGRGKDGRDVVDGLVVAEPPMLTDPVQKQDLEDALAAAGRPCATVRAVADGDPFAARTAAVVQDGGVLQAVVVDREGARVTKLDAAKATDEARALALPLAIDAALDVARARGAVDEVKVYVRAEATTPSDLSLERRGAALAFTAKGLLPGRDVRVVFEKSRVVVEA